MNISARIDSTHDRHEVTVETAGTAKTINIAPKVTGQGSSVNGGELLLLALATCFCNDLYREAAKRNLAVRGVQVDVHGRFGAEGEPGSDFRYNVQVDAEASPEEIAALVRETDRLAEVHNTLRKGIAVQLVH